MAVADDPPSAPMYFVYSLLLTLGFLILLPRFLFDALRHGKYVAGFRQRLGSLPEIESEGRPVVWLHCVSVGETQAARPLVLALRRRFPNHLLVVSSITRTGQNLAHQIFKNEVEHIFYFPFDWRWSVRRALNAIKPTSVLIMETELWPGFLRECRVRQIPVAVVNGRLSRQSFRRYSWIKGFLSRVLQSLSLAIMQTEDDASRIRKLGMARSKTFVSGSLKFDAGTIPLPASVAIGFRERFNLTSNSSLILAASTHGPEESIMLEVLKRLRANSAHQCRLLLAPRHPERFADVAALLKASDLSWTRRSNPADSADGNCDIILLDTIGELQAVYPLADVVFVGGSVAKTGGHNVLEPAAVGAAIVTGVNTFNFDAIVKAFVKDRALIQLRQMSPAETTSEIVRIFQDLLSDEERRRALGRRARELVERNLGATERTLELLDSILKPSSVVSPQSQTERGSY